MGESKKKQKNNIKVKFSINAKLLSIILPVVIIVVTILVVVSYMISKNIIEKKSENLLEISVKNQGVQIEGWIQEKLAGLSMAKKTIEGLHLKDNEINTVLNQYYNLDDDYPNGLYIVDENNNFYKAKDSKKLQSNPTSSEWYKQGITRYNLGLGSVYKDEDGNSIISASGILNDKSGILKVISADLSLETITIIVNSSIEMKDAQAMLIDLKDNTIIAHRNENLISTKLEDNGQNRLLSSILTKINQNDLTSYKVDDEMVVFRKIADTSWLLVSYVPISSVLSEVNNLRNIMLVIGLISVILLLLIILIAVRIIIKPLKSLTNNISVMTQGDFTIDVKTKGSDEIGLMGQGMEKFVVSMREMISDIHNISKEINNYSETSNSISREMFDVSKVQSNSMSELNKAVDQLSISINDIAKYATALATFAADTRRDSKTVGEKMQVTVSASKRGKNDMEHISSTMMKIDSSIANLEKDINNVGLASDKIIGIIDLIKNIAEETSLLSLNASIEAARAGEAGKGFGVVASQIGKLAVTSANAVQQIADLINEINGLVVETISQTKESSVQINNIGELINNALDTFSNIYQDISITNNLISEMIVKINKVDDVATNVASISEEQAASSDEILATSENMVAQANNVTKNSEYVAEVSKNLSETSKALEKGMNRFKV